MLMNGICLRHREELQEGKLQMGRGVRVCGEGGWKVTRVSGCVPCVYPLMKGRGLGGAQTVSCPTLVCLSSSQTMLGIRLRSQPLVGSASAVVAHGVHSEAPHSQEWVR